MRDALICLVNTACKLQSLDGDEEEEEDSGGYRKSLHTTLLSFYLYFIAEDAKKEVYVDQVDI